ncbi:hypothetical protein Q7P36_005011 [Cladosporium allicinum]
MESTGREAEPIAKGVWPAMKQNFSDLFKWEQRVEVRNEYGEARYEWMRPTPLRNPFSLMAQLTASNWLYFLVGLASWTADAFDFHALSIQTVKLAAYYKRSNTDISTAITLTLLLRSVGAAFFGAAGDRYGRKWPMVINMLVLGLLQIATIYAATFQQFLAVRSLFGLFMGGVYGNAIAMALENAPVEARGLMSGILQQGYSLGYVFAACANLGVGGAVETWKTVFVRIGLSWFSNPPHCIFPVHRGSSPPWIAAGLSIGVGLLRIAFPESKQFRDRKAEGHKTVTAGVFWGEVRVMIGQEWRLCVYAIILMTWFNFYSHTSQDSYTTFLRTEKGMNNTVASTASILMKTGACVGGTIIGYLSQWVGRRRAMCVAALISACLIPAWVLPNKFGGLAASGFMLQFFVQGAWGVIPIHLNELSPPAFRSTFPGRKPYHHTPQASTHHPPPNLTKNTVTYQLGNMISSPSAQIVNAIAESISISAIGGPSVPAYGPTMAIMTAIIALGIAVTTAFGPEKRGSRFESVVVGQATEAQEARRKVEGDEEKRGEFGVGGGTTGGCRRGC